jgi:asparagine synthase (glutamine-hydrolysing)
MAAPLDEGAVLAALRHRGPDGTGRQRWPDAGLLHARLKIIDLSPTGAEPMANEDGNVYVVFNGEIFNHRELRNDLCSQGHTFRGTCDAEVLPHLYEEHGPELFSLLRGMFSIAIYDVRHRRLMLARDRFGIKPLFYAQTDRFLAFASELNALKRFPTVDLTPSRQAISDFAALLYIPAPQTMFEGIRALEPGTLLDARLGADGSVDAEIRAFHRWVHEPRRDLSLGEAVAEADGLIEQAVARQLESDVPLGALLSGGIDSSLVSAAAQRRNIGAVQTFNVGFPQKDYDETTAARAVAAHIGSEHRTLEMSEESGQWERVTRMLWHAGQPFADTSMFAVDAIAEAMRRHVTVALSGDGGDEGFGGYRHYLRLGAVERLRRVPAPALRAVAQLAGVGASAGIVRASLPQRLHELGGVDDAELLQGFFSWIRGHEHGRLVLDAETLEPPRRWFEPRWQNEADSRIDGLVAHAIEIDMRLVLPNDFLFKVDIASMRHSLEVRVPLLDEDLIAFALTLPRTLRSTRQTGKLVLRGVAERRLPADVVSRRKRGFAVPVDRWVNSEFKNNLRETLLERQTAVEEYLDPHVFVPWVRAFCSNEPANGLSRAALYPRITMLLALELSLNGRS